MRTIPKCETCHAQEAIWAWHPFGPGEDHCFTTLGSHYRGWIVIKVCDECKNQIEDGLPMNFVVHGKQMIGNRSSDILEIPDYVGDSLLFWEMGGK